MINDVIDSYDDAPPASLDDTQQPLAFQGKIDYGSLFHQLFSGMQRLHATNQDERARELFYNSIGHFACLWDADFVRTFVDIQEMFEGDMVSQYRLHIPEFSRLMQRAGIAPKPDVKLVVTPEWDVPKTLDEFDVKPEEPSVEPSVEPDTNYFADDLGDDVDPFEDDNPYGEDGNV